MERSAPRMNKQVPPALVIAAIMVVVLFAFLAFTMIPPGGPGGPLAGKRPDKTIAAPDFSGTTPDGKTFKLSEQRGKIVLVNFWATWCGPCVAEVPELVRLQEKYGPQGFTVVGVSQDETLEVAEKFAKERGVNYPIMLQPDGLSQQYGVTGLPTSILVDQEGNVAWGMEGTLRGLSQYDVISVEIDRLLKQKK